jgi:transcriptional regulator with XRE-family HTH domain
MKINYPTKEEIKFARLDSRLTQKQAAELLGYSQGAWRKWEYGERPMRPKLFNLFLQYNFSGRIGKENSIHFYK